MDQTQKEKTPDKPYTDGSSGVAAPIEPEPLRKRNPPEREVEGREGNLWFETFGGVSQYDGRVFQDQEGTFWFGTNNGITRYRPPKHVPPPVYTDAVVTNRRYRKTAHPGASGKTGIVSIGDVV